MVVYIVKTRVDSGMLFAQNRAIIYPGLKKPSLDSDDIASYRPISNLSFTSKLLELAIQQIYGHRRNTRPCINQLHETKNKLKCFSTTLITAGHIDSFIKTINNAIKNCLHH